MTKLAPKHCRRRRKETLTTPLLAKILVYRNPRFRVSLHRLLHSVSPASSAFLSLAVTLGKMRGKRTLCVGATPWSVESCRFYSQKCAGICDAKGIGTTGELIMEPRRQRRAKAFTLTGLLITITVFALIAVIILPVLNRQRATNCGMNCVNNLKQIGLAFKLWSGDSGNYPMQVSVSKGGTMELVNSGMVSVHFLVMSNELSTPKVLFCPQETDPAKKYATSFSQTVNPDFSAAVPFTSDNNVSYFIGVDAEDGLLSSRLLCGDWNLAIGGVPAKHGLYEVRTNAPVSWVGTRHGHKGNIALADGSVQQVNASGLQSLLIQTGVATNRLAIP